MGAKRSTFHIVELEQNTVADKHSVLIAKCNTGSSQNSPIIQHKIDTGNDSNIMHYHIFKILITMATKDQLAATKIGVLF